MSDFSDVIERWVTPGRGRQCLLNTDDTDLIAWSAERTTGAPWQCHFRFERHREAAAQGLQALSFPEVPEQAFTDLYWAWPKARAEADMLLDWLPHLLTADGHLWLIGYNRGGIRSAPKALVAKGWTVHKMGSARHCVLLRATPPVPAEPFSLASYWATAALPGGGQVWSLPGVFAHGRLDKGSLQLLPWLQHLPSPLLDFGCGAGLLSLQAGRNNSGLEITGVDNHWLAILSSQRTAAENGLNLTPCWADGLREFTGPFAGLVTNPPFHTGLATNYDITHELLQQCGRVLQPGAPFLAVVNDHLPYAEWLEHYLQAPECVAHANGFRVWSARARV